MSYDIVIPATKRNMETLRLTVKYLQKNIKHDDIIVIGKEDIQQECENVLGCQFIHEDTLIPELTYENIRNMISQREPYAVHRTGWYLQQFIKFAYAIICEKDYYLIWDADTIPIAPYSMFDEDGIPYFDIKTEFHPPYFTILGKLFLESVKRQIPGSFICEHMIVKTSLMQEVIEKIQENPMLIGNTFFEKIINQIRLCDLGASGFSEYETYGSYVWKYHKKEYKLRHIDTLRPAERFVGYDLDEKMLKWIEKYYSLITIETERGKYQPNMRDWKKNIKNDYKRKHGR